MTKHRTSSCSAVFYYYLFIYFFYSTLCKKYTLLIKYLFSDSYHETESYWSYNNLWFSRSKTIIGAMVKGFRKFHVALLSIEKQL